ncbi:MAG: alpha-amylase family glycosyl hydrolase [Clostridium sp.]|nr:alpha-amylase family glycosyl hydrolase [Clostridium sp.]
MNFKKIKKIVACVAALTCVGTNIVASAAVNTNSDTQSVINGINPSDENVLKVDVDDSGEVTYTVPASASKYGDVTYDENRPFSWDNVNMYFTITDRFYNGDTSNDHSYGRSEGEIDASNYASRIGTFHGGDLKGLTQKIEEGYFDNLGINAIWFTAPYEQIHGAMTADGYKHYGYHGYWALDFSNMDANMGTEKDLENFIDTAHKHGIRVVMDVVMNHAGYANPVDANEYGYGKLAPNWKDMYYNTSESQYKWSSDYAGGKDASAQTPGMMEYSGDWSTNFWGSDWIRLMGDRFSGFDGKENGVSDLIVCSSGLPDFKTEDQSPKSLPKILENKWKKEGRYEKEMAELDAYFAKGHNKSISQYITKWLTDWVREYGIDGFRCDTAKHVEQSVWKALKDEASVALKEWRQNNPNKPGAKWTDDFWMTGESWGWTYNEVQGSSYFSNGFNSMINFGFQGNEGKSGGSLISFQQEYADKINSCNNNALSYISSHDKGLGQRSKQAGTVLELSPGGVQVFYGDESGRQGVGSGDQASRSHMNWDSINMDILSHWQKVGQFRTNHLAVGAGKQTKLDDVTAMREYSKNGVEDKVVISYPSGSSASVPVGTAFSEGETIRDFYTGNTYQVSGGSVQVTGITNGLVLLEKADGKIKAGVSATPGTAGSKYTYYDATLKVTLNAVGEGTVAKYSLNGGAQTSYKSGDTITITQAEGETTTLVLTGVDGDGNPIEAKTYTYARDKKPEGLTIYAKASIITSTPNLYAYDESTGTAKQLTGAWPGAPMKDAGNGLYSYELTGIQSCQVIINGSFGQYPGAQQPGIKLNASESAAWIFDGSSIKPYTVEKPLEASISVSKSAPTEVGKEVTFSANATGGDGKYSYEFRVDGNVEQSYSSNSTFKWTPVKEGAYTVKVNVKDASGKTANASLNWKADKKANELVINDFSTTASAQQYVNEAITLSADATGEGTVLYKFAYRLNGQEKVISSYSSKSSCKFTPSAAGTYTFVVYAKDDNGSQKTETIDVNVISNPITPLKITSFKTSVASPQEVGKTIKLSATATGSGTVRYHFYAYLNGKVVQQSALSTAKIYSWKPTKAGTYTIKVVATDSTGKIVAKQKSYLINQPINPLAITAFKADKVSPQAVNTSITLQVAATGGTGTKACKFTYSLNGGSETLIKNYDSISFATWKPTKAGTYTLKAYVKDDVGAVVTKTMTYVIASTPLKITSFTTSVASPQAVGKTITLSASAIGSGTVRYHFYVYSGTTIKVQSTLSTVKTYSWKPSKAGTYTLKVVATDASGKIVKATKTFVIK